MTRSFLPFVVASLLAAGACGGKPPTVIDEGPGTPPADASEDAATVEVEGLRVLVDGVEASDGDAFAFAATYSVPVEREVRVLNDGEHGFEVVSVHFDLEPGTGQLAQSEHVTVDWLDTGGPAALPILVPPGHPEGIELAVVYTPPAGGVPTDERASVLVLQVEAGDVTGELRLVFETPPTGGKPAVGPPDWTFAEAHLTTGQTATFEMGNAGFEPFTIFWAKLETPSFEYVLYPPGPLPKEVPPGGAGDAEAAVFQVVYKPNSLDESGNAVLLGTSASPEPVRVPLFAKAIPADYVVELDGDPGAYDFEDGGGPGPRPVTIRAAGPSPLAVGFPSVEPEQAGASFAVAVPAEVTTWPALLQPGDELTFEVTRKGALAAFGDLVFPVEAPFPGEAIVALRASEPRAGFAISPDLGSTTVTVDASAGETGTARVVVRNAGSGPFTITSAKVVGNGVFALAGPSPAGAVVPPFGLRAIDLAWDASALVDLEDGDGELLEIAWTDPAAGATETANHVLFAKDTGGASKPVAKVTSRQDLEAHPAGHTLLLDAKGSDEGDFAVSGEAFVWFLSKKPDTSKSRLDLVTGPFASFVPDVPGEYRVEVLFFASDGQDFVYSAPAEVTITALQAPPP